MAEDFKFIKETRKEKPVNYRRILHRLCVTGISAVVFGVIASLVIVFCVPALQARINKTTESSQISFEEDDPKEPAESQNHEEVDPSKDAQETTQQTDPKPPVIIEQKQKLEIADYQKVQNKLYDVGKEADKFVVSVTGVASDTDIFNNTYERKGIGSGIIIAKTKKSLLVLTEKKIIQNANAILVTFVDDSTVTGELLQYDGNTGLAVVRVNLSDMNAKTWDRIEIAKLGSSLGVSQGTMVLAVGSPLGVNHSILTGTITSNKNTITTADKNYTVLITDMLGSSDGSGALINTKGEVIGFVLQDYNLQKTQNTLTAVAISQLKKVIELLSNNKPIPYLGLKTTMVTEQMSKELDMPTGIYVKEVELDSPAMYGGFQSGDVITSMNGTEIKNAEQFENMVLDLNIDDVVNVTYQRQSDDVYIELANEIVVGVRK